MSGEGPEPREQAEQEVDATLALIGKLGPRAGIEKRMLAQLRGASQRRDAFAARYAAAAGGIFAVVALAATLQFAVARRQVRFVPARVPVAMGGHGIATAGAVASAKRAIEAPGAGRGMHAGRGRHGRVVLPRGVIAPTARELRPVPAR
jgi:hypothetical protein